MGLGAIIYRILIGPLELLFEVIFVIAERNVSNPAYAIIFLSLAMNFLVLPLYRRADEVQAEERDRENALAPWIKHIKKTFKGDERFMMLQAYYRENNFRPTDSLKGSVSLLLEIPFFIAAYHFLSNLETIKGVAFGPITDLGAPDALLTIGSLTINLLPIFMTFINVISAAIYMKGFPLKSKIQMYGIAAIFLVFLYNSPVGLVFYWTLNNLFSLVKNIFYKIPNPEKKLEILASVAGVVLLVLVIFVHPMPTKRIQAIVLAALLCLQIPLLKGDRHITISHIENKDASIVFYTSTVFLTLLTGILIPTSVIAASTEEFLSVIRWYSPYWYIVSSFTIAFGTFLVWFTIFYRLASKEGRILFSLLMSISAVAATMNYMFFGRDYGNFSSVLVYDETPVIHIENILINGVVLLFAAVVVYLVYIKKIPLVKTGTFAMCVALIIMSIININHIQMSIAKASSIIESAIKSDPEINLSKNGKNVVVIMMDRQIGHFVPFIMHEKPELEDSFKGFTYFSNCFSYGGYTNVGSPALYGGYDYTPTEMNKRSELTLEEKQNEALKVMPKLFSDSGYNVTVYDPTYAGYSWIPDLSIYDDMPDIKKAITIGRYSLPEFNYKADDETSRITRNRNFFLYSCFKIAPILFQPTIYNGGDYNKSKSNGIEWVQTRKNLFMAEGMNKLFMSSYAVLSNMPSITKINASDNNTFLMMSNDLTHEPTLLQEPMYTPAQKVDNSSIDEDEYIKRTDGKGNTIKLDTDIEITHYQTNVAAMLKLAEWLDYLKKEGVYDNTRIIIVSDHGRNLGNGVLPVIEYKNKEGEKAEFDTCFLDCVLMVKDFNSDGSSVSDEFISNADVPMFATENLIDSACNPYTGNLLRHIREGEKGNIYFGEYSTEINNGNTFLPDVWFQIRNNIYEKGNWSYLGVN